MADDSRQALLDKVVQHMLASGSSSMSLRAVAAAIGTSHRMLIYHFGGQDGLVEAVVEEVEARQRVVLHDLALEDDLGSAELSLAFWERLTAPELRPAQQLFFQLYSRLVERGHTERAAELVTSWLEPATSLLTARGHSEDEARRVARLGLACSRGLLLDLLATGDEDGVDAAARTYVAAVFGASGQGADPVTGDGGGGAAPAGRARQRAGRRAPSGP